MSDSVAGVVLAAGAGQRLAPLTSLRPKAMCPVGGRPLVDWALDRLAGAGLAGSGEVAVNALHLQSSLIEHLSGSVTVSIEAPLALGTAGALGQLRHWIDGRSVLVTNADAWLDRADLEGFVTGWDRERTRLLVVGTGADRSDFGSARYCGVALLPWSVVGQLEPEPSGLYEVMWEGLWEAGQLDLVTHAGPFIDCGTPADYLAANLMSSGGANVIGAGARISASAVVERAVVWDGAVVRSHERLVDAIRTDHRLTVLIR